jgi:cytosine/creatinine deaminase
VGAIPHFEDTREDGVRSVEIAIGIAAEHGLMVDAHCDEIDDEQSRFIEVLATLAARSGLRDRVTGSHTTAMGSYNLLAAGVSVAFGHDDLMDPRYPLGTANPAHRAGPASQLHAAAGHRPV